MAVFTTLTISVEIWFSTGTLGIFATVCMCMCCVYAGGDVCPGGNISQNSQRLNENVNGI